MASSSKPEKVYHVFLSFRGTDVRYNFLGHLYAALDLKGIYTYVDSEELRKGDEIGPALMKAIEKSHMAVIIFSEDYASSSWCLEEVAKIMECREERGLMVFTVFYKVEPREVRTPRDKYRKAMDRHESKFGENSEKVKKWKEALSKASNLSGWELKDGDDSEHIQRIVKDIANHLGRTPLRVAKHPVGIVSRVVKLKSMLNLESQGGVLMMGLWGKGGIGKTTIAKAIYNDIFGKFDGSCFLANVRETSKECKDLVTLQEKLLSEILLRKERLVVSSVDAGIELIQERLYHKKVLIVLDDVDDLRQLNALAGEGNWFGNGSRIIVTTRDKHLITCHAIDQVQVYEVKALEDSEARELLSNHAFSTHQKLDIRRELVDSVLNHAGGLPLALEVLGSFLCGRREDVWESSLKKLSRIPNKTINGVLKISYDGLEENEREIFLDIACFFKGRDSEYVKKVLNSRELEAVIGLEILIERSLINIEHGQLQMHDLIQSMGMDIVRLECRDDPGRRSRLWLLDDVVDVLSSGMGDCAIKAIVLEPPTLTEIYIGLDAFTKMKRLRLLILSNVRNSFRGPICVPNELRWFQWAGCATRFLEFSSCRRKLVGLDMSNCSILVEPNQFKGFLQLKYITLSYCESLVSMPDLSCTPNLEELDLKYCKNLVEAHKSVSYHDKLQVLRLTGCSELSVFPKVLKSKHLRGLYLDGCKKFERFPEIPNELEDLEELWLLGTAIKELPESIENLVFLEYLFLDNCKNLTSLPSSIYKLQNLEDLGIRGCTNFTWFPKYEDSVDPRMKTGLSNLASLRLEGCNLSEVEFLENLSCFPLLRQLRLAGNNITGLPTSLNKRAHLSQLIVQNCHRLQEIPELPPSITYLSADGCESLKSIGDLTSPHHFVRKGLAMADIYSSGRMPDHFIISLTGGNMPEWVFPIEGSVCFMASKDLYDSFLALALCFVVCNDESEELPLVVSHVNGKRLEHLISYSHESQGDQISLEYHKPCVLWEEVDFSQIDGSYVRFSVSSTGVKKWGFRILCKPLGDDLKVVLQENKLIDPALLYEVCHESTDSEAEGLLMHEDSSIKTDLHTDLQDCQMSTENHNQVVSKRNHKFVLPQGMRKTSNSIGRDEYGGVGLQLLLLE